MYTVNHWPEHCPKGHHLGPGRGSMSWDTEFKAHWLLCGGCERRSRILLDGTATQWQVYVAGRWVTVE